MAAYNALCIIRVFSLFNYLQSGNLVLLLSYILFYAVNIKHFVVVFFVAAAAS